MRSPRREQQKSWMPNAQPKTWDSAKIGVQRQGNWFLFTDKKNKVINEPPPVQKGTKRYYRYKGYEVQPPKPVYDQYGFREGQKEHFNYKVIMPRRELVSTYTKTPRQVTQEVMQGCYYGTNTKGWHGHVPQTVPYRMSTQIINERRKKLYDEYQNEVRVRTANGF